MIRTEDLEKELHDLLPDENYLTGEGLDKKYEIIKRLRAYEKLCHDLKLLIARMSNEVDK